MACGERFAYVDILSNPDIRTNLPKFANWPTFPQLWVGGELVGGCDIVTEMFENGELQILIKEAAAPAGGGGLIRRVPVGAISLKACPSGVFQLRQLVLGQRSGFVVFQFSRAGIVRVSPCSTRCSIAGMVAKHRPAAALGMIRQEIPVAVASGQVHRRVAPGLAARAGARQASIGIVAEGRPRSARPCWQHSSIRLSVGRYSLCSMACLAPLRIPVHRVVRQRIEPEFLDLLELLGIRKAA